MKKYQLMAPGPTPVPPNVLLAMARPIIHHRAAEYDTLFLEVREGLKRLVQTQQDVLTPACTGTGAMEAAVANTLSAGDRVIVVNAGAFAQRWLAICKAFGLAVVELEAPHGDTVSPDRIAQALRSGDTVRSEEHTSELQSHRDLHSFPTRRSSDLHLQGLRARRRRAGGAARRYGIAGSYRPGAPIRRYREGGARPAQRVLDGRAPRRARVCAGH